MRICGRTALAAAFAWLALAGGARIADGQQARISDGAVRIGLILDLAGPLSDTTGTGSLTAAKMAVEDFGGKVLGAPIDVLVADHQNSPDRALAIARNWFDTEHVDAIIDVSGSPTAQIVQRFADVRHKIVSLSAPGAARLSNEACTATSIHYVSDTRAIARTIAEPLLGMGDKSWFFITVDQAFGYDLENDTAAIVERLGGVVTGRARHPLDARDFTSYLARARQSQAKVIGLANSGGNLADTIRQAAKARMIPGPQVFAGLALRVNLVDALGLATAQGMTVAESFYWDMNDATRTWSRRYFERVKKMPNSLQAGVYSSTMHYLQAVAQSGTDDTDAVLKAMHEMPVNDFFARDGHIRADGVLVHDFYLFQVKSPAESKYPWDYYRLVATVPGNEAFGPLSQSKCPLVRR